MGNGIWLALLPVLPFTAIHDLLSSAHGAMWSSVLHIFLLTLCQASLAAGENLATPNPPPPSQPLAPSLKTLWSSGKSWDWGIRMGSYLTLLLKALLDLRQVTYFSYFSFGKKGKPHHHRYIVAIACLGGA